MAKFKKPLFLVVQPKAGPKKSVLVFWSAKRTPVRDPDRQHFVDPYALYCFLLYILEDPSVLGSSPLGELKGPICPFRGPSGVERSSTFAISILVRWSALGDQGRSPLGASPSKSFSSINISSINYGYKISKI